MITPPRKKPRVSRPDPAFSEAVASSLRDYRDGRNPERRKLKDTELAERIGVSKSSLSKYLSQNLRIGGEALARIITGLGISVKYKRQQISACDLQGTAKVQQQPAEQIAFVFDAPCVFKETTDSVSLTIERKPPKQQQVTVRIRIAG